MLAGTLVVLVISCRRLLGVARCALWKRLLSLGKDILITDPWFSTLDRLILPLCNRTSFHTSIKPIPLPVTFELMALLPRKWSLNSFFCSLAGIPIPVSFTSTLHESLFSDTKICTLPFSGVYFNAFDIIFFRIDSIFSLSNHTFIYRKLLSYVKLICLILA